MSGLSPDRLDRLDATMAGYVERGEVPGVVTLVSCRDETRVGVAGTLAFEDPTPMTRDTIFRISSMSKPFTAAAAMILVDECRVRLDDPVDDLLPELANPRVLTALDAPIEQTRAADRAITLRDLLTFRMGTGLVMAMPDTYPIQRAMSARDLGQGPPNPAGVPEPDEWMRRFGELPLIYQPGERWMYNTGSDVLGVLIARASGQPFDTFLQERIFEPLGMSDTGFWVPEAKQERFATAYLTDFQSGRLDRFDDPRTGQWSHPPAFPSGAGGLVSSVDDCLAFGRMMLRGGAGVLSRRSIGLMTTDHLTAAQKAASGGFQTHGWGFGLAVVTNPGEIYESVGKFGWDGGLGSSWQVDPTEDLITILMTQAAWVSPVPPRICQDFWTSTYAALE